MPPNLTSLHHDYLMIAYAAGETPNLSPHEPIHADQMAIADDLIDWGLLTEDYRLTDQGALVIAADLETGRQFFGPDDPPEYEPAFT